MRVVIWAFLVLVSTNYVLSQDKTKYSSSTIRDKYGRTAGRITTRTNSAATYQDIYNAKGAHEYSIRTTKTYSPSKSIKSYNSGKPAKSK